jgi:hypothetical protein
MNLMPDLESRMMGNYHVRFGKGGVILVKRDALPVHLLGTSLLYANSGTTNMDSLYVITSISDLNNYGNS